MWHNLLNYPYEAVWTSTLKKFQGEYVKKRTHNLMN